MCASVSVCECGTIENSQFKLCLIAGENQGLRASAPARQRANASECRFYFVVFSSKAGNMDGRLTGGSGVLIGSGLGSSGGGSGGGGGGASGAVFQNQVALFNGPNGSSRRLWRIQVAPQSFDKNALLIQYHTASGLWETANVIIAR